MLATSSRAQRHTDNKQARARAMPAALSACAMFATRAVHAHALHCQAGRLLHWCAPALHFSFDQYNRHPVKPAIPSGVSCGTGSQPGVTRFTPNWHWAFHTRPLCTAQARSWFPWLGGRSWIPASAAGRRGGECACCVLRCEHMYWPPCWFGTESTGVDVCGCPCAVRAPPPGRTGGLGE